MTGFIDQSPRIAEVAAGLAPGSVCLPFFAARGGHVLQDLPEALAAAGFAGRLLDPVGADRRVPGLIAAALIAAAGSAGPVEQFRTGGCEGGARRLPQLGEGG